MQALGMALAHRGDFGYMEWNHELLHKKLSRKSWRDA